MAYLGIITLIGNVASVVLAGWAAYEAEGASRLTIVVLLALTFLIPRLWPGIVVSLICFVGRVLLGIGCLVFLKWRQVL